MQEKKFTNLNFSARLCSLMETSGLKQKEIAQKSGVAAPALINYKNGRNLPSAVELYKLSKFFGCSMEWLLTGEDGDGAPNHAVAVWKTKAEEAEKKIEAMRAGLISWAKKF